MSSPELIAYGAATAAKIRPILYRLSPRTIESIYITFLLATDHPFSGLSCFMKIIHFSEYEH
jgi:hypothetical protein